jgi:hypothetical protein
MLILAASNKYLEQNNNYIHISGMCLHIYLQWGRHVAHAQMLNPKLEHMNHLQQQIHTGLWLHYLLRFPSMCYN